MNVVIEVAPLRMNLDDAPTVLGIMVGLPGQPLVEAEQAQCFVPEVLLRRTPLEVGPERLGIRIRGEGPWLTALLRNASEWRADAGERFIKNFGRKHPERRST